MLIDLRNCALTGHNFAYKHKLQASFQRAEKVGSRSDLFGVFM
jgi:hypothetical protein